MMLLISPAGNITVTCVFYYMQTQQWIQFLSVSCQGTAVANVLPCVSLRLSFITSNYIVYSLVFIHHSLSITWLQQSSDEQKINKPPVGFGPFLCKDLWFKMKSEAKKRKKTVQSVHEKCANTSTDMSICQSICRLQRRPDCADWKGRGGFCRCHGCHSTSSPSEAGQIYSSCLAMRTNCQENDERNNLIPVCESQFDQRVNSVSSYSLMDKRPYVT